MAQTIPRSHGAGLTRDGRSAAECRVWLMGSACLFPAVDVNNTLLTACWHET